MADVQAETLKREDVLVAAPIGLSQLCISTRKSVPNEDKAYLDDSPRN